MSQSATQLSEAIRTLLRLFTVNETLFPAAEGRMRHNPHDFQTLLYVQDHPGCRANQVAMFLGVVPTTAQSVIERLIKRDLILRARGESSREGVALTLTTRGAEICDAIRRQDVANSQRMLQALPAQERKQFVRNLQTIAASVSAEDERS